MLAALSRLPGRLRPLVVLALVAGVLAMHALMVGHHSGVSSSAARASSVSATAMHGTAHQTIRTATGLAGMELAGSVDAEKCVACGHDSPGSSHPGWHLLDLCVAVLLAGAVTMLLLLARGARGPSSFRRAVERAVSSPASSRRRRPPSLSQLCVLRT